jgi:hypothetical protein
VRSLKSTKLHGRDCVSSISFKLYLQNYISSAREIGFNEIDGLLNRAEERYLDLPVLTV